MADPYARTYWRGKTMDNISVASLTLVEDRLGRPIDSVIQGSFSSVTASAGTHTLGGAVDVWDRDPQLVCRLMREVGCWASWIRNPSQGSWGWHIHGILVGHQNLASLAASQVDMYKAGYNGLGWYDYRDDFPYRPSPIVAFNYYRADTGEDDMRAEDWDRFASIVDNKLKPLEKSLSAFRQGERARDAADADRDNIVIAKLVATRQFAAAQFDALARQVEDDPSLADVRDVVKANIARARDRLLGEIDTMTPAPPDDEATT